MVWAPTVHEHLYDEHCYYFLLRLRNPDNNFLTTSIQEQLIRDHIPSHCIYYLYGYYDVLIRIWATGQKRARFVRDLDANRAAVEAVHEFQARNIDFLWGKAAPTLNALPQYRPQIEAICKAVSERAKVPQKELSDLEAVGLIHKLPECTKSIKLYIALSKIPGAVAVSFETDHLVKALKADSLPFKNVSLYSGIGFANYLIKAVVEDYEQIITCTRGLLDTLNQLQLRPMTLLIANNDATESDQIDIEWEEMSTSLLQLELVLGSDYSEHISHLEKSARDEVGNVYRTYNHLLGTPFAPIFKGILTARLENDPTVLFEKLTFVMRLEGLLRKFFIELLARIFGTSEWVAQVKQSAAKCGVEPEKNPAKNFTLHDWVTVAGKMASDGLIPASEIENVLGPEWKTSLSDLKEIRNALAHGRLFEEDYALKNWKNIATTVFRVGNIHNVLITKYDDRYKRDGD